MRNNSNNNNNINNNNNNNINNNNSSNNSSSSNNNNNNNCDDINSHNKPLLKASKQPRDSLFFNGWFGDAGGGWNDDEKGGEDDGDGGDEDDDGRGGISPILGSSLNFKSSSRKVAPWFSWPGSVHAFSKWVMMLLF